MIDRESAGDPALRGLLTRAVGVEAEVQPDMQVTSVQAGDVYLLCSDGLTEMLADADIADILAMLGANPRVAAEHLVDLANERGGTDNVSVVVVSLQAEGRPSAVLA
jgi:protein phosphatase